jgi:hypothetical protein
MGLRYLKTEIKAIFTSFASNVTNDTGRFPGYLIAINYFYFS